MDTIIYFFIIIIIYFILYKVIDIKDNTKQQQKNCKVVRVSIHTPEPMFTHYRKISDFNEEYVPDEVFKKEHDNGENNHEWLKHFE
tara:strand:- start:1183 stop:1440 length:258 start_codon:yes stop_codon:yes gene_type:complete